MTAQFTEVPMTETIYSFLSKYPSKNLPVQIQKYKQQGKV